MIQLDDLVRTSQARIERLHRQRDLERQARDGRRSLGARQRIARLLYAWARSLDPSLYGEKRHHPVF